MFCATSETEGEVVQVNQVLFFKPIVNRFKGAGYTLDIMRQIACLTFNQIRVEGYAALCGCTAVSKPQALM